MNRLEKKKNIKMVGYGALFITPMVLGSSALFASLQMNNTLSVFLTVLIGSTSGFVYYLIFSKIAEKKEENKKDFKDPFNH